MGANANQCLKAFQEAAAYDGPSIIICYAPCINHGIKMPFNQAEQKKAVAAGYWNLFRFNPDLAKAGKNPFTLDSKAPSADYVQFIEGETRYSALKRSFPGKARRRLRTRNYSHPSIRRKKCSHRWWTWRHF